MINIVAVIPARMGSCRFPGKPLAAILGLPMIEHVFRRAAMCTDLEAVYIATPDEEIRVAATSFGATVIMTSDKHERASDRVAEAVENIDAEIVVMLQGDEPMITPGMISAAIRPLVEDASVQCVNLVHRISTEEEFADPNTIKVVINARSEALYYSRSPIPAFRSGSLHDWPAYKQVCVIPFRAAYLQTFNELSSTPLEIAESIDMLRILEHGGSVRLVETEIETHAVDTPEDLLLVERLMQNDPLIRQYEMSKMGSSV
jgi:3-deoxy-manno-octulosonate cytidylyltransferase (CMP-KDO synthetase)